MNIAQYINELLIDTDCVIIPGLGGFVANYQSAMVSGNAHVSFMPPSKQLLFNVKLTQNDGLLVAKVSRSQNISYKHAEQYVVDFVYALKKQLHQEGSFSIEGIGVLLLNVNNILSFEPTVDINLNADSFGLSSFMFPQLNYGIRSKQHVAFKHALPKRNVVLTKTLKRIAVVVPLILLLAILPTVYLKNVQQSSILSLCDSNNEKASDVKQSVIVSKQQSKKSVVAVSVPVSINTEQTEKYHIIIGCFRNERTAQDLCESFKCKGFKTTVLVINNLYKVSLQSYNDIVEANTALHSLQDTNARFVDSWLLTVNK